MSKGLGTKLLKGLAVGLLFVVALAGSVALADASPDLPAKTLSTRPAIDLIYASIAGPVGALGVDVVIPIDEVWAVDAGLGLGFFGGHGTVNARRYLSDIQGGQHYLLLGTSYSGGVPARKDDRDRNQDGIIGNAPQFADAFWLNFAYGLTLTNSWGLRYGMELGVTVTVANSWKRKNQSRTEDAGFCDFLCLEPPRIRNGMIEPAISLLKVGYSF